MILYLLACTSGVLTEFAPAPPPVTTPEPELPPLELSITSPEALSFVGDRVAAIGDLGDAQADERIDVAGHVVAPGFVDVHTHDDRLLFADPAMKAKTSQGVTTVVVGNCGVSLAPFEAPGRPKAPLDLIFGLDPVRFPTFAAFLDQVDRQPAAANAAFLVGHQTLRVADMRDLQRPANADEIASMRASLEQFAGIRNPQRPQPDRTPAQDRNWQTRRQCLSCRRPGNRAFRAEFKEQKC